MSSKTIEKWLKNEVGPTYDAMLAAPSQGIRLVDVFAALRRQHDIRTGRSG